MSYYNGGWSLILISIAETVVFAWIYGTPSSVVRAVRPVERGGEGEVFPGPATFVGPHHRSKILKRVFQMASF